MSIKTPCELISWNRFYHLCQILASRIRDAGFQPDLIVAIGRGGWMPARVLADFFGVMDLTGFNIVHYRGSHMEPEAKVKYPLSVSLDHQRVLLVDDVSDSGDTFEVAVDHLRKHGVPEIIRTAALHHKIASRFEPDFHAARIVKWRWIIYPWAVLEDLKSFIKEMEPPPVSVKEIAQRLQEEYGIYITQRQIRNLLSIIDRGSLGVPDLDLS